MQGPHRRSLRHSLRVPIAHAQRAPVRTGPAPPGRQAVPRPRTHAPPDGSPTSWAGQRHYGDAALRDWIVRYRPDLVLCGHIHQAPFRRGGCWVDRIADTWVFNAGRQIGPVPAHVVIDTAARTACWYSLAGAEQLRLDDPQARPAPLVA